MFRLSTEPAVHVLYCSFIKMLVSRERERERERERKKERKKERERASERESESDLNYKNI